MGERPLSYEELQAQRRVTYDGWLSGIDSSLKTGPVKNAIRSPVEQVGVYRDGQHVSDIYAEDMQFGEQEFKKAIEGLGK